MRIEELTVWKIHKKYHMEVEYNDGKGYYPTKVKHFETVADLLVSVAYYLKKGNWGK